MNRTGRAKLAQETLQILEDGCYVNSQDERVEIRDMIQLCCTESTYFDPAKLEKLEEEFTNLESPRLSTESVVANETTLEGASFLVAQQTFQRIGVLNFASAKRPGGGFLKGSAAQEESLARSSGLYASLTQFPEFYAHHRRMKNGAYSDRMIYSPDCPVFRENSGRLLDRPYRVDFITSAAPNAGALRRRGGRSVQKIPAILKQRAGKTLALAWTRGCDALVLGAWGCGVFKNDPAMVAAVFGDLLLDGGPYRGCFSAVRFSVFDDSTDLTTFKAFSRALVSSADHGTHQH